MPNPFVEGFELARRSIANDRSTALAQERARLQNQALETEIANAEIDRQRADAAFEANRERFGDIAGNPTATGQLAGIQQRQQIFEEGQQDRQNERARQAFGAAFGALRQGQSQGVPATQTLINLPPAFREAVGLSDDVIAQLGPVIDSDPTALDQLEASLNGPQQPAELQEGRGPDGSRVFFRVGRDGLPEIVDGVTPDFTPSASASRVTSSGLPGGFSRRPDGSVVDADGNRASQAAIDDALRRQSGLKTEGREAAKIDVAETSEETLRKRENAANNVLQVSGTVIRDAGRALALFDSGNLGGNGVGAGELRLAQSKISGTDAFELQALISSVESNVGIDSLLDIKREGAGLGQVPQSQLEQLNRLLGNLDIRRDPAALRSDIQDILTLYQDVVQKAQLDLDDVNSIRAGRRGEAPVNTPSANPLTQAELDELAELEARFGGQ